MFRISCAVLILVLISLTESSPVTTTVRSNKEVAANRENKVHSNLTDSYPLELEEDDDSDEDDDDSIYVDQVEEKNRDKFVDETLDSLLQSGHKQELPTVIEGAPVNSKTFQCPRYKGSFLTGSSVGSITPEDIDVISAMGDCLSTGSGLWPRTNIEFRGAAFSSGGDATIDGLVTIPNILREFNPNLAGVSHGMGTSEQLPEQQLNVANCGAMSKDLPLQAKELVKRIRGTHDFSSSEVWVMVIITIGTEEVCSRCGGADYAAIISAVDILNMGLPRAFVVLLGPLHVSDMKSQDDNILIKRCACLNNSASRLANIASNWTTEFRKVQEYADELTRMKSTFGVLALPSLTITSRFPDTLFITKKKTPLLNRRGHMYATKWLWNRLVTGSQYNLSSAILSQDKYSCPSSGCPYFHNTANANGCHLLPMSEASGKTLVINRGRTIVKKERRRSKEWLYGATGFILCAALLFVLIGGVFCYQNSKQQGDHGRFEVVDEAQLKLEEAQKKEKKEEERSLLRQSTRALSTDPMTRSMSMSARRLNSESERASIRE